MSLIQGLNRPVTTNGSGIARIVCRRGAIRLAALALPGCAVAVGRSPAGRRSIERFGSGR